MSEPVDTSAPAPEDLKVNIDDDGPSAATGVAAPETPADAPAAAAAAPGKDEPPKPLFPSVLGVDFGSTKVSASLFRATDLFPTLVPNELANRITPAVVVFDSKTRLTGEPADLVKNRGGAITAAKANVMNNTVVNITYRDGAVGVRPQHVGAMLLQRQLADVDRFELANNHKGDSTRRAVLSVPAAMPATAVKALKQTAELAGYEVLSVVYDVSCAALVYTHRIAMALAAEKEAKAKGKKPAAAAAGGAAPETAANDAPANVVFLDMGHDWASVQVAHADPANRVLRVLATESRHGCGAAAFGTALVDVWTQELLTRHKIDVAKLGGAQRERALMRLQSQAEKAKNMLSGLPEVAVVVDSVVPDFDLKTKVTRASMEAACQHILLGLTELFDKALAGAGLTIADVARVEVVGGGSRIPCIQQLVKTHFGDTKLFKTLDSECTQSYGAALFGAIAGGPGFLAFTVEGGAGKVGPAADEVDNAPGLSADELAAIRALEAQMRDDDAEVKRKSDAKNQLEVFIFDTRRESTDTTVGVDDEEALDRLRGMLSNAEDWIYGEGEETDAAGLLAKLEAVKAEAAELAPKLMDTLRKRDEKRRQEVLEAQQQPDVPKAAKKNKAHLRPAEKIADARSKKDHGNTLFKENNTEDACKRYTQAIGICAEMDGTLSPEDQQAVNEIKVAAYLNLVLCNIKLKLPKLALHNANKAIEIEPKSAKPYYRRAQALIETKDYEDAKKDLLNAKKLDPDNVAKLDVAGLLAKVDKGIAAEKEKQKKTFGRMFASSSDKATAKAGDDKPAEKSSE